MLVHADAGTLEGKHSIPLQKCAEKAIFVLSRIAGEGRDCERRGNFRLTKSEVRDIRKLTEMYEHFTLVLNVGGVVDLTPVIDVVPNILLMSQLGAVSSEVLLDVLMGRSYPSGKLTATWAAESDYLGLDAFGDPDNTIYSEDIFVGYKNFEQRSVQPVWPFGFGLMNSNFSFEATDFMFSEGDFSVSVRIKNTGSRNAKDILQLYTAKPADKLNQPPKCLVAYKKTPELCPGEEISLVLSGKAYDLASYDEKSRQWILERGTYRFYLGEDCENVVLCGESCLEAEIKVDMCMPKNDPYEKHRAEAHRIAGQLSNELLTLVCLGRYSDGQILNTIGQASVTVAGAAGETTDRCKEYGLPSIVMADGPAVLRLDTQYGKDENGVYTVSNAQMQRYAKYVPENIRLLIQAKRGNALPRNGEIFDQHCTAIPIGTALAQSWNPEIGWLCGDIVGDEMERHGVHLWLAPAMNIQRLPLCGRNFEYYSEDPVVSGKMAAAICRGIQSHHGRGACIKHFAANNQETNRYRSNSVVSERALREIYLKPFEICIREAQPHALMTSYNLINGTHTSEDPRLLLGILRGEWNYQGLILSDWVTENATKYTESKYPAAKASASIAAGNDLFMPGCQKDYEDVIAAIGKSLSQDTLRCAAERNMAVTLFLSKKKTRIFCLGDSITYGAGVLLSRCKDSYPAILEHQLGSSYEVFNFGITSATASEAGDFPYAKTEEYAQALSEPADDYVIMLGTNDSKPYNWDLEKYVSGLVRIIKSCRQKNPAARIFLGIPPVAFPADGDLNNPLPFDIQGEILMEKLPEVIRQLAERMGCETIDLQSVTQQHPEWFADGCHPNREGNQSIARYVKNALKKG